jgi:tetratricopeptide (TPR) repeat protein
MRRLWCALAVLALAAQALPISAHQEAPVPSVHNVTPLHGEEELGRVYDSILEARFDQVDAELRRACGPAPAEACDVMAATALWWRILLDPENRALDDEFSTAAERAIRTSEEWTKRSPDDAEAWFYLGGAYAARVQWRVLRGANLAAARDGKRIKEALERATELAPNLDDAYFGIGLYQYYADVAPAAAKFLRFLLLLPGGDREAGLAQMLRARNSGRLIKGEADYQLHLIYLWYEESTDRALELLRGLAKEYPTNPLFLIGIAEIQDTYLHDTTASLATWRTLLGMARDQDVNEAGLAEVRARLGLAKQLEALHQTDRAIEQLQTVVAAKPAAPFSSLSFAYLRLGQAYDRMGHRTQAMSAYRSAAATAPRDGLYNIAEESARRMRSAPDPRKGHAYRLSLEGWRKLEQNDLNGATEALEQSVALNPGDPVTRYRYGRLMQARREDAAALEQFELTVAESDDCPPAVLGTAYLEGARLYERSGDRDRALSWYRIASTLFGAAQETRAAAARALERLQKLR